MFGYSGLAANERAFKLHSNSSDLGVDFFDIHERLY